MQGANWETWCNGQMGCLKVVIQIQ